MRTQPGHILFRSFQGSPGNQTRDDLPGCLPSVRGAAPAGKQLVVQAALHESQLLHLAESPWSQAHAAPELTIEMSDAVESAFACDQRNGLARLVQFDAGFAASHVIHIV